MPSLHIKSHIGSMIYHLSRFILNYLHPMKYPRW